MTLPNSDALIGALYDAASGACSWEHTATIIRTTFNATSSNVFLITNSPAPRPPETLDMFGVTGNAASEYGAYYAAQDPWIRGGMALITERPETTQRTHFGTDFFDDKTLLNSEFYRDFARKIGARHGLFMTPTAGMSGLFCLSIFRPHDAAPFNDRERLLLQSLLPHVQRAIALRQQLLSANAATSLVTAAWDNLPMPILVVGEDLRVALINTSAESLLKRGDGAALRRGAPGPHAPTFLTAASSEEYEMLRNVVRSVANGKSAGGHLRISRGVGRRPLAVMVMPLPASFIGQSHATSLVEKRALLLLRDLDRVQAVQIDDAEMMFGLTRAEAEIAIALASGSTAETVATQRGATVGTVRSQIRAVLAKTNTRNLRELTALFAAFSQ